MRGKRVQWMVAMTAALALGAGALVATAAQKGPADVVAMVNGSKITQAAYDRETRRVQQYLRAMGKSVEGPQWAEMKKRILETLIERELLYQESRKAAIEVEKTAVDAEIDKLKKRFPTDADFQKALQRMNFSEAEARGEIERALAVQRFMAENAPKGAAVTDAEVKTYYESHPQLFQQPERVRASHILIKVDSKADQAGRDKAREQAEALRVRASKGEDFAALAKEFSQGPSAPNGGDLGLFGRGKMVKPFEDVAFALKPGEVGAVVETKFGYHVIKVTEKKPAATAPYDMVKEQLREHLQKARAQQEMGLMVQKLKEKAKVERYPAPESK